MKTIYLLSGRIRSGKDYVADLLVKHFGFTRYAFADALKKEVSIEYNMDMNCFNTQFGKATFNPRFRCTNRDLLIKYSSAKKKNNINYYTDKLVDKLNNEKNDLIVISDFRYQYEYDRLKENPQFCVKTVCVYRDKSVFLNIESENSLEEFEYNMLIDNNKDENHVINQFSTILKQVKDNN